MNGKYLEIYFIFFVFRHGLKGPLAKTRWLGHIFIYVHVELRSQASQSIHSVAKIRQCMENGVSKH